MDMQIAYRGIVQQSHTSEYTIEKRETLPDLAPHDVCVKVKACTISVISPEIFSEVLKSTPRLQYIVGQDIAGVVTQVGSQVKSLQPGDKISGILPLDSQCSGCADYSVIHEYNAVRVPERVSFVQAAAAVGAGLKAYTALHYQARLSAGETLLVTDAAAPWCILAAQLASIWGAKVLTASPSPSEDEVILSAIKQPTDKVIDLSGKNDILLSRVMEETGGIGADVIIDNGLRLFKREDDAREAGEDVITAWPSKRQLLACLAVAGRWVTTHPDLQLDPPDCHQLFLRAASVSFLFECTWLLSMSRHGRLQHVLADILEKVADGCLRPSITQTLMSLDDALEYLQKRSPSRTSCVMLEL